MSARCHTHVFVGMLIAGELNWVHGIALDSKQNLYFGDIIGKRIQKFVKTLTPGRIYN